MDDARIIFRNFTGAASKYNRAGDKNFAVVIPTEEMANALVEEGWNVKIRPPRGDSDEPFMYLQVKVKFNERGPKVYLKTGDVMNPLDEESVACLDDIDILQVDLDVRPYDWVVQEGTPNEKRGRSAYLQSIHVTQQVDRFAMRYTDQDEVDPF
jgi:hypothetical protein